MKLKSGESGHKYSRLPDKPSDQTWSHAKKDVDKASFLNSHWICGHWKKTLLALLCICGLFYLVVDFNEKRKSHPALSMIYLWSVSYAKNCKRWMDIICSQNIDPFEQDSNLSNISLSNYESPEVEKLFADEKASRVFMLETTCRHDIRPRTLCVMESYAYHNQNSSVIGLFLMPYLRDFNGVVRSILDAYPNIHLLTYNLSQLVEGTPVERLVNDGSWTAKPDWIPQSLSDLFRIAVVWKHGGLYTDNDILCLQKLPFVQWENDDVLTSEHTTALANGFFKVDIKHPFLMEVMNYLANNYNPSFWGFSGPSAFTKAIKSFCHKKEIYEMWLENGKCDNITVLTSEQLFPIHWSKAHTIFESPTPYANTKFLDNSIGVHFANSKTHSITADVDGGSLFSILAAKHCPVTFNILKQAKIKHF